MTKPQFCWPGTMEYGEDEGSGTSKKHGKKHIGLSMGSVKRDLALKGRNVLSRKGK